MESACKRGNFVLPAFTLYLFFVAGLVLVTAGHGEDYYATCVIVPMGIPGMNISGTIRLHESGDLHVTTVVGHLNGFESRNYSQRGFHVHEFGSLGGNCSAAGNHYNPFNKTHGAPTDDNRHVGDLGNIVVDSSLHSVINITDSVISLHGDYSIIGRAIVVHSGVDDLGKGGTDVSNTTGNSGYRIGCCVITLGPLPTTASPTAAPPTTAPPQPGQAATPVGPLAGFLLIALAGLQLLMKDIQL